MSSEEEKWAAANHALRTVKDKLLKAQLDVVKLAAERDTLQSQFIEKDKEIARLKGIEKDHLNDWKRIQDAERENDELRAALEKLTTEEFYWVYEPLKKIFDIREFARQALQNTKKEG